MTDDNSDANAERTKLARALLEKYASEQKVKPFVHDANYTDPCPEMGPAEEMVYDIYARRKGREPLRISISNASWEILFKVAEGEDLATFVGHLVDYIVLDARTSRGRELMDRYAQSLSPDGPLQET